LSGGDENDIEAAPRLIEDIFGFPVPADRGYGGGRFRKLPVSQNNTPAIPGRRNRKKPVECDKQRYKGHGLIGRVFGKLKENRRLAVRYEKSDIGLLGFIFIAFVKIWLC
jgi:transposase